MLAFMWYWLTIVGAFIWLVGSPALSTRLNLFELACAAVCVGTLAGAWTTYLAGAALSMLATQTMLVSLAACGMLLLPRWVSFTHAWRRAVREALSWRLADVLTGRTSEGTDVAWGTALVAIAAVPLYILYSSHMIPTENGKIHSGGSCWADFPIHMHICESFLSGRNSDVSWGEMQSPVFAGERLVYPFLPDWHAAVLVHMGASMRWGFFLPGYALCLAFIGLLFALTVRVTRSRLGGVIALLLTFGAGGMGALDVWQQRGWSESLSTDTAQNDASGSNKIFWFAFLPHVFLPQRGANFAYPTAVLVLLMVWQAMDDSVRRSEDVRRGLLMHAAGIAAMLPLVQAHSFIGLGIISGTLFVLDCHKWLADHAYLRSWIAAGVVAAALGAPQLSLFTGHVSHAQGGHFMNFGMIYSGQPYSTAEGLPWALLPFVGGFFRFWWMSLGPALPLFLLALVGISYEVVVAALEGARLRRSMGPDGVTAFARGEAPIGQKDALPASTGTEALGDDASLVVHLGRIALHQLPLQVQDVLTGKVPLTITAVDTLVAPTNTLSVTGRGLDSLKLGLAGLAVFAIGNYVNFQPWNRDNCKLFYLWIFVASALSGAVLAAPIEFFLGIFPGYPRVYQATGVGQRDVFDLSRSMLQGKRVAPPSARDASAQSSFQPRGDADAHIGTARRWVARGFALGGGIAAPFVLFLACFTGFAMIYREFHMYHVMLDEDQQAVGRYIRENISPKAVMVHSDVHIQPSGCLAGRPSLIGYTGWMWSHGYDYGERDRDRNEIMSRVLQRSGSDAYNRLRRWGIRYVVTENLYPQPSAEQQAWEDAKRRKEESPGDESIIVPNFDPDLFLDGQLRRVFSQGRFGVYEVLGYGFPPT